MLHMQNDKVHRCRYCSAVSESVVPDVRLIRTHAHDTGDIGHFTERDFCQTEAASDVISGKGEKGN